MDTTRARRNIITTYWSMVLVGVALVLLGMMANTLITDVLAYLGALSFFFSSGTAAFLSARKQLERRYIKVMYIWTFIIGVSIMAFYAYVQFTGQYHDFSPFFFLFVLVGGLGWIQVLAAIGLEKVIRLAKKKVS